VQRNNNLLSVTKSEKVVKARKRPASTLHSVPPRIRALIPSSHVPIGPFKHERFFGVDLFSPEVR